MISQDFADESIGNGAANESDNLNNNLQTVLELTAVNG